MPPAAETFVLDTSALLCLKENEPGASEVEAILRQHGKKEAVFISFMSVMELAYILEQYSRRSLTVQFPPVVTVQSEHFCSIRA